MPVFRGGEDESSDLVAVEEPLEIRICGEPLAILMRTPGDDHRLALGFLFSGRLISSSADVIAVFHRGRPGEEGHGNAVEVMPAPGASIDWERIDGARLRFTAGSGCGVCGRTAIAELLSGLAPPPDGRVFAASAIIEAVGALREHQPAFAASGGTHAAATWDRDGALVAAHEDVGRHNAVDKVVGALRLAREEAQQRGAPLPEPALLALSSRASLEVVQKAARAHPGRGYGVRAHAVRRRGRPGRRAHPRGIRPGGPDG